MATGNLEPMSSRRMLVNELKGRVERREYSVDCRAVAEAFIAQTGCWYPTTERVPVRSRMTRPGSPMATRPTRMNGSAGGPAAHSS